MQAQLTRTRAFGDESGTRSALAVARVFLRRIDGAAEALAPVLELPPPKRIHGIVTSVEHVRTALRAVEDPGRVNPCMRGWPSRTGTCGLP